MPLPRTITSFIYKFMASVAIIKNVTKKKYCSNAAIKTQMPVKFVL